MEAETTPRQTVVDTVTARLRERILLGEHRPGERLPPERHLAAALDVARVSLRKALDRLAREGLLTVRQGRGYTVQDFRERGGPSLLQALASLGGLGEQVSGGFPAVARDLLLVRRCLARAVLERLAERADASVREDVRAALQGLAATLGDGEEAIAEADLAVMRIILRATGSPVLELCWNPLAAVVRTHPRLRRALYAQPETNLAAYLLLDAWLGAPSKEGVDALVAELARRDAQTVLDLETPSEGDA